MSLMNAVPATRMPRGLCTAYPDSAAARPPAPGYPERPNSVGTCLRVIMSEEIEHRRYMVRDLAVLEAR
jgi:hypothetical protein